MKLKTRTISVVGAEKLRLAGESRFLVLARTKFGDKFNYERVRFTKQKDYVEIGCPIHGYFLQTPDKHLQSTFGCPKCGVRARADKSLVQGEFRFIENFAKFGDNLELLTKYISVKDPITCRCKIHDVIIKTTPDRLNNLTCPCPKCANEASSNRQVMSQSEFISKLEAKFGEQLNFSNTVYKNYNIGLKTHKSRLTLVSILLIFNMVKNVKFFDRLLGAVTTKFTVGYEISVIC